MTKEIERQMKELLLRHRQQILRKVKLKDNAAATTSTDEISDEGDLAASDQRQTMDLRLGNRDALYLKKVEQALERLHEGRYGSCESCGGEIELRRLEVRPTAEMCIVCKQEAERLEGTTIEGQRSKSVGTLFHFNKN